MQTNLESLTPGNIWTLNRLHPAFVPGRRRSSRGYRFIWPAGVGWRWGEHRGGSANDGHFRNDSTVLQQGGRAGSRVNGRFGSMDRTLRNLRDRGGIEAAFFPPLLFISKRHQQTRIRYTSRVIIGSGYQDCLCAGWWVRRGGRRGTGIYSTALIGRDVVCGCVNIDVACDKIIQQIASQGSDQRQHFPICFFSPPLSDISISPQIFRASYAVMGFLGGCDEFSLQWLNASSRLKA